MLGFSLFKLSLPGAKEKKGVVSVEEARQFFESVSLYNTQGLRLDEIYDKNQLKQKLEQINEYHYGPFTQETRNSVKKYIETYAQDASLLHQIDEIEREKHGLYVFLQETEERFRDIPVNLIEEKVKTHSSQKSLEDIKLLFIEGSCLSSKFLRDSIDPSDPLNNYKTYKHAEFHIRSLIIAFNGMMFDANETALKEQTEGFLTVLSDWWLDLKRPREQRFSDLQQKMAHVTKQGLLVSLQYSQAI